MGHPKFLIKFCIILIIKWLNIQLKNYGSRGQCRLASILLKIAVSRVFDQDILLNNKIVYLIDDVIGELDLQTIDYFFNFLSTKHQVFFASTEKLNIFSKQPKVILNVSNGMFSY